MTLQRLIKVAPVSEALIRVYRGKAVLNAQAARLLDITSEDLVAVCFDKEQYDARGVKRLYIGKASCNAYRLKRRVDTYTICSVPLCKSIADSLEGYGTYRICPEDSTQGLDGNMYYNIFLKKYD